MISRFTGEETNKPGETENSIQSDNQRDGSDEAGKKDLE